ncbi:hypothetical protein A2526_05895 [candidate division WOR-1 bacterium RIFOXYD2_FULL_36_8]|uniref:Uncharacterized protein n=1 Tax=candidate division WOR-1 bacterium RIFOXYB2_FULL_36_35 TaxID=1802578 RepID=A0A1F4RYR2_UNCSA|nr:MAG: hypothetical protein A2230_08765 [candidate division WOR-1 bacterium RIFOXYA2_FULL_36_21]OGC13301.1 MAG: hypothetical protein A2290_08210 [candidate division WOR-1 bacterium RIFOXYB2_FULL_36_35]OGC16780.1 MAG: hypothetical protein A2282_04790 [candidate division WOR-1 bacterium RIFOXYA12_FULL_36_13]OGC37465.1 MAG: hypothetical protein A2526_05895 [candidate division WOR-1 bacterium RIFOXYD2_FULL_36_8]
MFIIKQGDTNATIKRSLFGSNLSLSLIAIALLVTAFFMVKKGNYFPPFFLVPIALVLIYSIFYKREEASSLEFDFLANQLNYHPFQENKIIPIPLSEAEFQTKEEIHTHRKGGKSFFISLSIKYNENREQKALPIIDSADYNEAIIVIKYLNKLHKNGKIKLDKIGQLLASYNMPKFPTKVATVLQVLWFIAILFIIQKQHLPMPPFAVTIFLLIVFLIPALILFFIYSSKKDKALLDLYKNKIEEEIYDQEDSAAKDQLAEKLIKKVKEFTADEMLALVGYMVDLPKSQLVFKKDELSKKEYHNIATKLFDDNNDIVLTAVQFGKLENYLQEEMT